MGQIKPSAHEHLYSEIGKLNLLVGVIVLSAFAAGAVAVVAQGGSPTVHTQVMKLEAEAYGLYANGQYAACFAKAVEIQKRDPHNGRAMYLMGLSTVAKGGDGLPLIREASRLGDGMADSYLAQAGDKKPCNPCAPTTGTATPGS